tara:strand:- start:2026 stop:2793 length:768 start_codon:yes stop_codon:yes gene_type:complete
MSLKVLDLFAGIGGFSLGLENTNKFKTVAFCENDVDCQKVLQKHWPSVPIFNDITELTYEKIKERKIEKPDVIVGGFPCQDISDANIDREKTGGIKGKRSGLWSEFARLIEEIQPSWTIIENVASLRNKGLALVLQDLWKIGYDAEWHVISACSVGAIHRRERVFIVAYPNSKRLQRHSEGLEEFGQVCSQIQISSMRSRTREKEWLSVSQPSGMDDGVSRRAYRLRQLGNAVVPPVVEAIGNCILDTYENERNI